MICCKSSCLSVISRPSWEYFVRIPLKNLTFLKKEADRIRGINNSAHAHVFTNYHALSIPLQIQSLQYFCPFVLKFVLFRCRAANIWPMLVFNSHLNKEDLYFAVPLKRMEHVFGVSSERPHQFNRLLRQGRGTDGLFHSESPWHW